MINNDAITSPYYYILLQKQKSSYTPFIFNCKEIYESNMLEYDAKAVSDSIFEFAKYEIKTLIFVLD